MPAWVGSTSISSRLVTGKEGKKWQKKKTNKKQISNKEEKKLLTTATTRPGRRKKKERTEQGGKHENHIHIYLTTHWAGERKGGKLREKKKLPLLVKM